MIRDVELQDVAEIIMGQSPDGTNYNESGDGLPLLTGAGQFGDRFPEPTQYSRSGAKVSTIGDIIMSIRASIGDLNWSDRRYYLGRGVAALRPREKAFGPFLWRFLETQRDWLNSRATGSTFKQIKKDDLAELIVPLPPLDEQRRIASILDQVDELRRKRRLALENLNLLPQAIFEEMFGDPITNPKGWPGREIGACLHDLHGGANLEPEDFVQSGFPVLHKGAIKRAGLVSTDPRKKVFVTPERASQLPRNIVDSAFVAVTLRDLVPSGPTLGLVADLSRAKCSQYLLAQGVYAFELDREQVLPDFFVWLSNNGSFRRELRRYAVGSTQIHMRIPVYKGLAIPLPPITFQRRFGEMMGAVYDEIELQNGHLTGLDQLFFSLQNLAFSGQLLRSHRAKAIAV